MFLLTRRGKYGHLCGTSVMGRETIHKGMEFGVCPEDPDLHKSCPGNYVCSERSSSEKWSNYGRSEVENSRNHPGRSCHLMKKLRSMQGQPLGSRFSELLVECTVQNYMCFFWEPKLLFPVPVTFASGQKRWSQKQCQLAIPVFCPEPNSRGGGILQGSTSGSGLPSISCQVSSWDIPSSPLSFCHHTSFASCGFGFTLIDFRKIQGEQFLLERCNFEGLWRLVRGLLIQSGIN